MRGGSERARENVPNRCSRSVVMGRHCVIPAGVCQTTESEHTSYANTLTGDRNATCAPLTRHSERQFCYELRARTVLVALWRAGSERPTSRELLCGTSGNIHHTRLL